MRNTSPPPLNELPAGHTTCLPARPATMLHVVRGRLWVTCSNDPSDHFVSAGESLRLGHGRVVLEADGGEAARYRLVNATGTSVPQPAQTQNQVRPRLNRQWA